MENSLADQCVYTLDDPFNTNLAKNIYTNEDERKVITDFGKFIGLENPRGYFTSGGTDGNMGAFWWHRKILEGKSYHIVESINKEIENKKT